MTNTYRKSRTVNKATDPATRVVVAAMNESGLYMYQIAEAAGVDRSTLVGWRYGRNPGRPFTLGCVRGAIERLKQ